MSSTSAAPTLPHPSNPTRTTPFSTLGRLVAPPRAFSVCVESQEVVVERPDAQTEKLELKLIEGSPGNYEGRYKPVKMGTYKVSIDPGTTGSDGDVVPNGVSLDHIAKAAGLLERMAQQTLPARPIKKPRGAKR